MAILNIIDVSRGWCMLNFGPLRGQVNSPHFPKRIDARRQYFYFLYKNLGVIHRKRLGQTFWIKTWIYHYLLNGIRFFFNCDSLHERLNSRYEAWSQKKKKHKKITAYRKSVQKEPTVKSCPLILDLKQLRSQVESILKTENSRVQLCEERNC